MYHLRLFITTIHITNLYGKNQQINGLIEGLMIKRLYGLYPYEYHIFRRGWLMRAKYIEGPFRSHMVTNQYILDCNNIIIASYFTINKVYYFRFITNKSLSYLLYTTNRNAYFVSNVYPPRKYESAIMNAIDYIFG